MAEYISGEKHRELTANQPRKVEIPKSFLAIIGVIILMALSFYGGTAYQKSKQPKVSTTATVAGGTGQAGGGRRFGGGQRPTFGVATAISPTSITVQDSNTGASTTLSITSTTQIIDSGQTVTTSDIQTGSTVAIVASTTNKTQAARILVNPSFGGGSSQSSNPSSSTSD
jgi:hypothetical protein